MAIPRDCHHLPCSVGRVCRRPDGHELGYLRLSLVVLWSLWPYLLPRLLVWIVFGWRMGDERNFLCAIRFWTRLLSSGSVISDQSSFLDLCFEDCFPFEAEELERCEEDISVSVSEPELESSVRVC